MARRILPILEQAFSTNTIRFLSGHLHCDKKKLKATWKECLRLGRYEFGGSQREALFETTKPFGKLIDEYESILRRLEGTSKEQESFRKEWLAKGIKEAKLDVNRDT